MDRVARPAKGSSVLRSLPQATLSLLLLSDHIDIASDKEANNSPKAREAKAMLWEALQAGRLEATGLPSRDMPRVPIPAHEWHDLEAIEEKGRDVLRHGLNSLTGYDKIVISRRSVLALWPEIRRT